MAKYVAVQDSPPLVCEFFAGFLDVPVETFCVVGVHASYLGLSPITIQGGLKFGPLFREGLFGMVA